MSNKRCEDCYYADICNGEDVCEDFDPIDLDAFIDEMIERRREEFYEDWNTYISNNEE